MKLIDRIKQRHAEMAALTASIQDFASEQVALKTIIKAKAGSKEITFSKKECIGLSKDQILEKFAEATEQALIETERSSNVEALKRIILDRQNAIDDLATDSDELMELEPEEGSIVPNYDLEPPAIIVPEDAEAMEAERERQAVLAKSGQQESFSLSVTLNARQMMGKELTEQGKSFCFIGPAGCGKTTGAREIAKAIVQSGKTSFTRYKGPNDEQGKRTYVTSASMAFVAYTRRAASNLAKAIWKDPFLAKELASNIMTIHALLEYEPETYYDPTEQKEKFRFTPRRTASNPLDITHLVIEEASMLGLDLWAKLYDALPLGVQIIFIGDINQLPPVFGPSILNYALMQLPIVELTEVYRNQGIVLENAHHILKGEDLEEDSNYRIVRGKNPVQLGQFETMRALKNLFKLSSETVGDDGLLEYDPKDCMILSPFNKHELGTDNINKHIAQFEGDKRKAIVYEIIAGFNKQYLAVGDRVMFNKMDAKILRIHRNVNYHGKEPQPEGTDLSRHGFRILGKHEMAAFDDDDALANYDTFSLEQIEGEEAGRKQQASHIVEIQYDDGRTEELRSAGDFQQQVFSLGYCLTVHKAQGSEWRKVFIVLHKEHAVSLYRELFYTAATRARTKVTILAKDFVIAKAIRNQRIKGNTLADKLEFFNSGIDQLTSVNCVKV